MTIKLNADMPAKVAKCAACGATIFGLGGCVCSYCDRIICDGCGVEIDEDILCPECHKADKED